MKCRVKRVFTGLAVLVICLTAGVFTGMTVSAQGSKTVTEALDISAKQYLDVLRTYSKPGNNFFLGTPYPTSYDARRYGGIYDFRSPNGDPWQGTARMQCTGFVWYVLKLAGAPEGRIPHLRVGSSAIYQHPYNRDGWMAWMRNNDIERYDFATKAELMRSGRLSYGDIIWVWNENDGGKYYASDTHHIGIYVGDGASDLFWNSEGAGNHISNIHGLASRVSYTLVKATPGGQWEYADAHWKYKRADGSYLADSWGKIAGIWYYFDADGVMATGWRDVNGSRYYMNRSGAMQTGWVYDGGKWYYMESWGGMRRGWLNRGGTWYYLDTDGVMATGWRDVNGSRYYMDQSGAMRTGWVYDGGKWYYMESWGGMRRGWLNRGGTWYYLDTDGVMATGWRTVNGSRYYMDQSGAMRTGWVYDDGSWYYMDSWGGAKYGWFYQSGTWYYLGKKGRMLTGLQQIGTDLFAFRASGAMLTGWQWIGGKWYYFNASGYGHRGWLLDRGKWYYLLDSGEMVTGSYKIEGQLSLFDASGAWLGYGREEEKEADDLQKENPQNPEKTGNDKEKTGDEGAEARNENEGLDVATSVPNHENEGQADPAEAVSDDSAAQNGDGAPQNE